MFGNLGPAEMIIILALALIVFGPKKLPEIGKGIGNALREFNKAKNDFMESIHTEPDRDDYHSRTPAYSEPSYSPSHLADGEHGHELAASPEGTVPHDYHSAEAHGGVGHAKLEYPAPLALESADALPYGSEFHAAEGDSQPSFRTKDPESPALAASVSAPVGAGKA